MQVATLRSAGRVTVKKVERVQSGLNVKPSRPNCGGRIGAERSGWNSCTIGSYQKTCGGEIWKWDDGRSEGEGFCPDCPGSPNPSWDSIGTNAHSDLWAPLGYGPYLQVIG